MASALAWSGQYVDLIILSVRSSQLADVVENHAYAA